MTNNIHEIAIILNGPPGCGKDTLAKGLDYHGFKQYAMKEELYTATAKYFGFPLEFFRELATNRLTKDVAQDGLVIGDDLITPRQALIMLSEDILKPLYGNNYFGDMTAKAIRKDLASHAVISDGGFAEEVVPIQELFKRTIIIRLYREGFTFENDSRGYLKDFEDTHDIDLVENDIYSAVDTILAIAFSS